MAKVTRGISLPAYEVMFKSDESRTTVKEELRKITAPQGSPRPRFVCVTPDFRRHFPAIKPDLWSQCLNRPDYTFGSLPSRTVFICPRFLDLEPQPQRLDPYVCPDVRDNKFARNSHGTTFPRSRTTVIFLNLLKMYQSYTEKGNGWADVMNNAVARNTTDSLRAPVNFLLFVNCEYLRSKSSRKFFCCSASN